MAAGERERWDSKNKNITYRNVPSSLSLSLSLTHTLPFSRHSLSHSVVESGWNNVGSKEVYDVRVSMHQRETLNLERTRLP